MYRFLLSLIVALAIFPPAFADEAPATEQKIVSDTPAMKADPAFGVKYTEERVVELPKDGDKFYLTVIGNPSDARFKQVMGWMKDVPELSAVKSQCHFNAIETTSVMYAKRYQKTVPALPCIRVQDKDGNPLFQCSGDNVPMSGEALTKAINTECLRRWRRNNAQPAPVNPDVVPDDGDAVPDTDVTPDTTPDTDPQPEPEPGFPWLVMLVVLGGGLVGGTGWSIAKKYKAKYIDHLE